MVGKTVMNHCKLTRVGQDGRAVVLGSAKVVIVGVLFMSSFYFGRGHNMIFQRADTLFDSFTTS